MKQQNFSRLKTILRGIMNETISKHMKKPEIDATQI